MAEQRVGNKIQKWDEISGTATETVDVSVQLPDSGKPSPIRSLEDQIEQNDNMLDGIVNNLPEETIAEKEARTSVYTKLKDFRPEIDERPRKPLFPELVR